MLESQKSYRQIIKATSFLGGVQLFQILVQLIRSKFIAIFLGPSGLGILGLFTSSISLIESITNFGLKTSAVRNLAEATSSTNNEKMTIVIIVIKKLMWITGAFGCIVTIILSSQLSEITFGNRYYTFSYIWLSLSLLFNQLANSQTVILQGLRELKKLAQANIYGSIVSLALNIPLYYYFGIKSIVPSIIITSISSFIISKYYAKIVPNLILKIPSKQIYDISIDMIKMGFLISLSSLITLGSSYILRIFISRWGSVEDVGLYSAGFAIIGSYVGLIFTAMSTDYYPRLTLVSSCNVTSRITINQQAEIAILIIGPIIIFFLVFIELIIILLYSSDFIGIKDMMYWASIGMFFKAASWSIGYIFLTKGSSKLFFLSELASSTIFFVLNLIGYLYFGLSGLGFSFLIGYILTFLQIYIIAKIKFQFFFFPDFIKIFIIQLFLAVLCLIIIITINKPISTILGVLIFLGSIFHSYKELNKRIDFKSVFSDLRKKL